VIAGSSSQNRNETAAATRYSTLEDECKGGGASVNTRNALASRLLANRNMTVSQDQPFKSFQNKQQVREL
jgi:hypothetical protein